MEIKCSQSGMPMRIYVYSAKLSYFFCIGLLWCPIAFLIGCSKGYDDLSSGKEVVICDRLPPGWRMMVKSEMPPHDKVPWWVDNPMIIEGKSLNQWDFWAKKQIVASRVISAIYAKDEMRVVIFGLVYQNVKDASEQCESIMQSQGRDGLPEQRERLVGFARDRNDIVVFMDIEVPLNCSDRSFFEKYFYAKYDVGGNNPIRAESQPKTGVDEAPKK